MYILHLSDIHYRRDFGKGFRNANGDGYQNMLSAMQNPTVFLDECLDRVAGDRETVDLVVVTGDLTEDGNAEDYRSLKHHIRERIGDVPLVVTLGNHDNKQSFREGWLKEGTDGERTAGSCDSRPYHQVEWVDGTAVISFDTSAQGVPDGRLDEERLNWLRTALKEVGNHPAILVTHHHLLCEQGQIPPLPESGRLLELIGDSGIFLILCGHTHHHYAGLAAGRPCHIADSLSFCGDNVGGGKVRFQEKYGYNSYRIEEGMVRMSRSETFANGRILGTLTF